MVFKKFTSACLFQIAREKSWDYLLIICMKKKTENQNKWNFDSARFLMKSIQLISWSRLQRLSNSNFTRPKRFKVIQLWTWKCVRIDFKPFKHLSKKTWFTIISKLNAQSESSSIIKAWRLQELLTRMSTCRHSKKVLLKTVLA